ncbi:MAG: aldo/keto reductase [Acholeplasmatales bacterium]|nr:MAG: aldo/keto reductase [Acholeplasmatales bacterium]
MSVLKDTFVLANGVHIPKLGFGTAPLKGAAAYQAVKTALDVGYRHIDTAAIYLNEEEVGRAVKDSGLNRDALFITSKLDASIKSYDAAIEACHASLKHLNTDYLDLYLIHAPWPWDEKYRDYSAGNVAAFKALEDLYKAGHVRAIGVSNFDPGDLENILAHCDIVPHVNQIKLHIGHPQFATVKMCKTHDILVEAYSPLGRAKVLTHPALVEMADRYGVSTAQLCLRYVLDKDILPLPRSANPKNILANTELHFTLDAADLKALDALTIESIEFGTPVKKA